jgi:uncharacterized delta-60 repeat protein
MPRLTLLLAAVLLVLAAPAGADTGRVSFPVGLPAPAANVDVSGAAAAAALPGGGAVLVGDEWGRGLVAAAIDADGRPDPAFGTRGVSHVRTPDDFRTLGVLVRPDGRLLVAGGLVGSKRRQLPELVVVGLTADGRLDASFGDGGVAMPGVQASCGGCSPIALAPDGTILVTGNSGSQSPEIARDPDAPDTFTWVVTRVTADGRPDPAFGTRQVPGTAIGGSGGYGVAVAPDGRITLLGRDAERSAAARVLPDGTADPAFARGGPAAVPANVALNLVLGGDGSVTALGLQSVARLRPDGTRDAGFGDGGVVRLDAAFGGLAAAEDGAVLVFRPQVQAHRASEPALVVDRLDASGRRTTMRLHLPFGGGVASFLRSARFPAALDQNAFRAAALVPRPGGGYLAAGGVTLAQYSGEGEGRSTATFAAAALTPGLRLDRSYGPARATVRASVRLARQRLRGARRVRGIGVRVRATRPGLMRVRIRDRHGRTLARSVEPLYRAGSARVRIPLTGFGRRSLRDHRVVRVAVEARFRDLLAAEDAAPRVRGTLR